MKAKGYWVMEDNSVVGFLPERREGPEPELIPAKELEFYENWAHNIFQNLVRNPSKLWIVGSN